MNMFELIVLAIDLGVVLFAFGATILTRDIIRSAIFFGIGSAFLAASFFLLSAPFAGAFEISIGAGLITVLTISTISLVTYEETPSITEEGAKDLECAEVKKPIKEELKKVDKKDEE